METDGPQGACPECGSQLRTPLACGSCGALLDVSDADPTPFAILGLKVAFGVDAKDARKRLRRIAHKVHPDFYATEGGELLARAEHNHALLNHAYEVVTSDVRRADWIVQHLGGPGEKDLGSMHQEFLMEVMEWNEVLDENEPGSEAFESLGAELRVERASLLSSIEGHLTPLPDPASPEGAEALKDVRKDLNALRYVDRALLRVSGQPTPL
ncbi:MAG: iron-sulfur cluster co-chaperone HscB C-terminal domain-containing protein, partial [Planctomycetota bacterium]